MINQYRLSNLRKKERITLRISRIMRCQANYFKLDPFDLYYIKTTDTILPRNSLQCIFL